jgi:hypothetical protein
VLRYLVIDCNYVEEILTFFVGERDSNRGPLPDDGLRRFVVSIESPSLTLTTVVRGMLRNRGCQTDTMIRQRYSVKVFSVLRLIAQALKRLHCQGFVHGDLCLESCGKFEEKWKLINLLGVQRIGEAIDSSRLSFSAPPEAVQSFTHVGSYQRSAFRDDLVAHPSLDLWAYGKVAFEVLVGQPLISSDINDSFDDESLKLLLQWNNVNVLDVRRQLERVGILEAGIELVLQCLSPIADTRLSIDDVLQHSVWAELSRLPHAK